ncbi:hypothetical protein ACHAWX_004021 [Stephanocyclus meneghinianus]
MECDDNTTEICASSNRSCLNITSTSSCGYCINGYIEINGECLNIDGFESDEFNDTLTVLLDQYLPEFSLKNVTLQQRLAKFIAICRVISYWNSMTPSLDFELGLNHESFLVDEERSKRLGVRADLTFDPSDSVRGPLGRFEIDAGLAKNRDFRSLMMRKYRKRRLEGAVDWHAQGYTTRIKNQGLCGCCWAVSTAAAIESALLITDKTKKTDTDEDSISFQQLITCDKENLGCNGGNILYATKYAWENNDFNNGNYGGVLSFADYPFEDFWGNDPQTCKASGKTPKVYLNYPSVVTSVSDPSSFEERRDLVMTAVSQQPITTTMKSHCDIISLYRKGVLTKDSGCECCDAACIDHAVVIVGYDTTADVPYWKLRNSWGPTWGEEGHFRVAMNDPGCGWGLFGMLAESAIMKDAYSSLEELPERPGWWETAQTWQKVLVIFGSILGFICVCSIIWGLWQQRGGDETIPSTQAEKNGCDEPSEQLSVRNGNTNEVLAMSGTNSNGL